MKIITFAHRLEIGGTQVNAIDLAAGLRDLHGCEVILFATPGPLARVARAKKLRFVEAPDAYVHPSPARMGALRALVRAERPDVIHAWDWWQCLDAYYSVFLPWRVPLVTTDMMPTVARVLPKLVRTTFGTPELVDTAHAAGRPKVDLLLPPVDIWANAPAVVDTTEFVERHGLNDGLVNVVTVSRLSTWLKSESLIRTVESIRTIGAELPVRLVIVGDGEARSRLETLADDVNVELGRRAVILTGALLDPRPAYAAADIVVGMGSSALRALAFAKPVIVVGGAGFSAIFSAATARQFLYGGMYGIGDYDPGSTVLAQQIASLATDTNTRSHLGNIGRHFVEENFAVEVVAAGLHRTLQRAIADGVPRLPCVMDAFRTTSVYFRERRFLCPSRDKSPVDGVTDADSQRAKN